MKKNICFLTVFLNVLLSIAQDPAITYVNRLGGTGEDYLNAIIRLNNGNFISAGYSTSTDHDITGSHGSADFFIVCTNPSGRLVWKKGIGGSKADGINYNHSKECLSATADGGFFFAGTTESIDGDIQHAKGGMDVFVARFDSDGNILWKNNYGGAGNETVYSIEYTADGGCLFAGTTYSNNDGDVPVNHSTGADIWLVKLNSTGSVLWSKNYGGSGNDAAVCIRSTPDGGYIFTGDTKSEDGDLAGTVPLGVSRKTDIWVVKINDTGIISWQKRIGGSDDDDGARVLVSANGDYFILAESRSSDVDIPANFGLYDIILLKLNASGDIQFITNHGSTAWDTGMDLVETGDGNILIGGLTYSTKIDGISIPANGECEALLLRLDKNSGTLKSVKAFGGSDRDFIRSLCLSSKEEVVVAGETRSNNVDFPGGYGGYDAIVCVIAPGNVIKGHIFYDYNNNNKKDGNEPYVENTQVVTTDSKGWALSSYTIDGTYTNYTDTGTFKTYVRLFKPAYFKVTPDTLRTAFSDYYGVVTQDIALVPVPNKKDLQSIIVGLGAARAGFSTSYKLLGFNTGTETIQAGSMIFIKEHRSSLVSVFPRQDITRGDTLIWNYTNLKSLDTLVFDIVVELARPPAIKIDDRVLFKSLMEPVAGDITPKDNGYTLLHIVTGAYDPNDKKESHGGIYTSANLTNSDHLNYTIRFQNTGNDTAFKITVKDTISSRLDISTLELLSTSHPAKMQITDNVCTWTFDQINLPDSNRNEPESHGYIQYRIKPAATAKINDSIVNSASIYFDFNLPIITNTEVTVIKPQLLPPVPQVDQVKDLCVNQPAQKIKLLNIPGLEYQVIIDVTINEEHVDVNADSIILISFEALDAGKYTLKVAYMNESDTTSVSNEFELFASAAPEVDLVAEPSSVSGAQMNIQLNAIKQKGNGHLFTYLFARDRNFTDVIREEATTSFTIIPSGSLKAGDNLFFVRIRTDDTCSLINTAVDSVLVKMTAGTDSENSGAISIAPNPFKTNFTVKGLNPSITSNFKVIDVNGRTIFTKTSKGQESVLVDGRNFPSLTFLIFYNERKQQMKMLPLLKR